MGSLSDIIRDCSFLNDCRHIEQLGIGPFSRRYLDQHQVQGANDLVTNLQLLHPMLPVKES